MKSLKTQGEHRKPDTVRIMREFANAVQLIGALVTMLGLSHAYTRAKYGLGLWRWTLSKLRRRGPDQTVTMNGIPSAEAFGQFTISNRADASFELDRTQAVEQQLFQLEIHMRNLYKLYPELSRGISELKTAIDCLPDYVQAQVSMATADTKRHVDKRLHDWDAEQTQAEVLDLRIAILGLAITVLGQILGFLA